MLLSALLLLSSALLLCSGELDYCEQGVNCRLPDCYCGGIKIPGNLNSNMMLKILVKEKKRCEKNNRGKLFKVACPRSGRRSLCS